MITFPSVSMTMFLFLYGPTVNAPAIAVSVALHVKLPPRILMPSPSEEELPGICTQTLLVVFAVTLPPFIINAVFE